MVGISLFNKKGTYLCHNRHSDLAVIVYFGKSTDLQFDFCLLKSVELRYLLMNC